MLSSGGTGRSAAAAVTSEAALWPVPLQTGVAARVLDVTAVAAVRVDR